MMSFHIENKNKDKDKIKFIPQTALLHESSEPSNQDISVHKTTKQTQMALKSIVFPHF